MKQKKSDKEVARLLKRWAMDVANRLRWREDFSASEAVKGISAAYDNYEYKEQPGEVTSVQYDYFLYWDLGVEGYRTFKASRLIDYLTLNIER